MWWRRCAASRRRPARRWCTAPPARTGLAWSSRSRSAPSGCGGRPWSRPARRPPTACTRSWAGCAPPQRTRPTSTRRPPTTVSRGPRPWRLSSTRSTTVMAECWGGSPPAGSARVTSRRCAYRCSTRDDAAPGPERACGWRFPGGAEQDSADRAGPGGRRVGEVGRDGEAADAVDPLALGRCHGLVAGDRAAELGAAEGEQAAAERQHRGRVLALVGDVARGGIADREPGLHALGGEPAGRRGLPRHRGPAAVPAGPPAGFPGHMVAPQLGRNPDVRHPDLVPVVQDAPAPAAGPERGVAPRRVGGMAAPVAGAPQGGVSRLPRRVVAQFRVLVQALRHVDAEPGDPPVEPEPEDLAELGVHRGLAPVQVGLAVQEAVQVVLAGRLMPGPGGVTRRIQPVVRRAAARGRIGPHVVVAVPRVAASPGIDEPGVSGAGVIGYHAEEHPHPPPPCPAPQPAGAGPGPTGGVPPPL